MRSSIEYTPDFADIQFSVVEWLELHKSPFLSSPDFDLETIQLILNEGLKFSMYKVAPTHTTGDREGCQLKNGRVIIPQCFHQLYWEFFDLGWGSLTSSTQYGGQQAPQLLGLAVKEAITGANLSFYMLAGLADASSRMLEAYASPALKDKYLKKIITGEYGSTMCLSEPHAGSDIGASQTSAEPIGDGQFKIKGTKCWITAADQNVTSNIIHTVLARIKGAPEAMSLS